MMLLPENRNGKGKLEEEGIGPGGIAHNLGLLVVGVNQVEGSKRGLKAPACHPVKIDFAIVGTVLGN